MPHGRPRQHTEDSGTMIYQAMTMIPFNPMPDGTCRTIKSQYQQSSLANFLRRGGYGATAVAVIEEE